MKAAAPLRLQLRSIGIVGPGIAGWDEARAALADPSCWQSRPTIVPAPQRLPPAERRRAGEIIKLSLAVAEQACAAAEADPAPLATVFSASTGDGNNCHALCEVLAGADRLVSPTRFTNSVHNASGGYWHIATASQAPSTSLCAHDASFGAGLLEAAVQCVADQRPVLLVAADAGYPEPMHSARPITDAFGVALLLEPCSEAPAIAVLELQLGAGEVTRCAHPGLESLRSGVPAARCLPLLQALAHGAPAAIDIEYLDPGSLQVTLSPHAA